MFNALRFAPALAFAAVGLGCGGASAPAAPTAKKMPIKMDEVPANLLDAAKNDKEMADVVFNEAFRKTEADGKTLKGYELRGKRKSDGKTREVMVAPDGRIVERE